MAICIFPGTFNPIHNAHIKMAEIVLEKFNFDKIIFIPAYIPPHKTVAGNLAEHRLKMVKLATSSNPKFEVSDFEYKNDSKSYSLITVRNFIEEYSIKGKINFIMGTDAFVKLNSWYKSEELKKLVHFIVFPRRGDGDDKIYQEFKSNDWDFEIVEADFMDISSTGIRENKEDKHTDKQVEGYIKEHGLYKY